MICHHFALSISRAFQAHFCVLARPLSALCTLKSPLDLSSPSFAVSSYRAADSETGGALEIIPQLTGSNETVTLSSCQYHYNVHLLPNCHQTIL